MARTAALRVAATANDDAPPAAKRWQGEDPVFFHRSQVKVGTLLRCMGRIDHSSRWRVVEIRSERPGRARTVTVQVCERLGDAILLERVGYSTERRWMHFANLSYSAIWRLE